MPTEELRALAQRALESLLAQTLVQVEHPGDWARPSGWPLPAKRNKVLSADGSSTQPYRPLALLEYVDGELSGANKAAQMTERHAAVKAGAPWSDLA